MTTPREVTAIVIKQLEFDSEILIPAAVVAHAKVNSEFREIVDGWAITLSSFVWSEGVTDATHVVEFRTPRSWWQHFKLTFFPELLKHYFPVEFEVERREVVIERKAIFPKLAVAAGLKEGDDFVIKTEIEERVLQ